MYMFSRVQPFNDEVKLFDNPQAIGAYHTSDVPYWFQTLDALNLFRETRRWTSYDRRLSDRMSDCLVAFATGALPGPRRRRGPNGRRRWNVTSISATAST